MTWIDPVFLRIGNLEIRYYGLIYAMMFTVGLFMMIKISEYNLKSKKDKRYEKFNKDAVYDYMIYLILGSILTARLFYIIFYNLNFYITNPVEIFAFWHGGMSIHGGLVGGVLATILFCKKRKIDFYTVADVVTIPLALGLAIGRIGNFINQELYGKLTNLPWGVTFETAIGKRHPSQLYESGKNLIIFGTLLLLNKKRQKPGTIFWTFIMMYGILRFIVEYFRDIQTFSLFFNLTMGQILSIPMIILGTIMLVKINRKNLK
jgi:phosphatidylglycerol:prolipoprotein diacylglycerol transferase